MTDKKNEVTFSLPETGYLRLRQLLGNPKANPPVPAIFPFSKSTLYSKIKAGTFPPPTKLGPRMSGWRVETIRALLAEMES